MNTKRFHKSNLGSFGGCLPVDFFGYVTVHDSPRYETASEAQLDEWSASRFAAIRTAVTVERACRALGKWQRTGTL